MTLLGYVETSPKAEYKNGHRVYSYKEISTLQYDKVVVANIYTDDIKAIIQVNKLDINKFIFLYPWRAIDDEVGGKLFHWNELQFIAPKYLNEKLEWHDKYFVANRTSIDDVKSTFTDQYPVLKRDYFRYRTFELVADQLKELEGAVAEVGVFQGEFSMLINAKFPEKKLYLFDTFESFEKGEYEKERNAGNCEEGFDKKFKYTSVEKVLTRMTYPEKCIVKKGLFPTTAEGIDEKFVFVSIDVDFEKSTYDSLCWFYPRMVEGGIIFVHDYNDKALIGVGKAVRQFEEEIGRLHKLPLADWRGSIAIMK